MGPHHSSHSNNDSRESSSSRGSSSMQLGLNHKWKKQFRRCEIQLLEELFKDLCRDSKKRTLDKAAFLQLFNLPGMLGERLFAAFDVKKNGVIEYEEFMSGLAVYCLGSFDDKIRILFTMYDLAGNGSISRDEFSTMLYSLADAYENPDEEQHFFGKNTHISHSKSPNAQTLSPRTRELPKRISEGGVDSENPSNGSSKECSRKPSEERIISNVAIPRGTPGRVLYDKMQHTSLSNAYSSPQSASPSAASPCAGSPFYSPTGTPRNLEMNDNQTKTPTTTTTSTTSTPTRETTQINITNVTTTLVNVTITPGTSRSTHDDDNVTTTNKLAPAKKRSTSLTSPQNPNTTSIAGKPIPEIVESVFNEFVGNNYDHKLHFKDFKKFAESETEIERVMEKAFVWRHWNIFDRRSSQLCDDDSESDQSHDDSESSNHHGHVRKSNSHSKLARTFGSMKRSMSVPHLKNLGKHRDRHKDKNKEQPRRHITCPNCHWELKHCFKCGGQVVCQSKGHDASTCDKCGKLGHFTYCLCCGARLKEHTDPDIEEPRRQSSNGLIHEEEDEDEIHHEGYLKKMGARFGGWKERWYVLRENFLYTYHSPEEVQPSHVLFMEGCFIEIPDEKDTKHNYDRHDHELYPLQVVTGSGEVRKTLYASSEEDQQAWIEALQQGAHATPIESTYKIGHLIGKGRFSKVYLGTLKKTGEQFAIKVIDKQAIALNTAEREALRTELAILKMVHHPSIIRMYNVYTSKTHISIVTNLVQSGDLFDRILARKRFDEDTARLIVWKIIAAVKYLHLRGIVHRDLKPENILCADNDDDTSIIIADFGLSKFAAPKEIMKMPCGTLAYVAPEVLKLDGYTKAVDIWSIGIIMYLLLRGSLPFDGQSKEEIIKRTLHHKLNFKHPAWLHCSNEAIDLIEKFLTRDPKKRINIDEAVMHKFFDPLSDDVRACMPTEESLDHDDWCGS